jgi:NAD(P)-dependent dehydrogenase (short-subunit alcohol dehydrogenase family)
LSGRTEKEHDAKAERDDKKALSAKRDFKGKVVFITGAAGGMGRALSRRFGRAGARLALTDMDGAAVRILSGGLAGEGVEALGIELDVTDEAACRNAVDIVVTHFGSLDVLVNNAGITHRSAFSQTSGAVYRKVMDVNYFGSLHCTQAALRHLVRGQGLIIVMSSIAGFAPLLGRTGYSASKHALHGLFDSLRTELRITGVDVTIVCPGFTATNIDKNALDGDGRTTSHPQSKVGKVAAPEEVAEAVFRAAVRGRRLVVLSGVGRMTRVLTRVYPALYEWIMARSLRSELER